MGQDIVACDYCGSHFHGSCRLTKKRTEEVRLCPNCDALLNCGVDDPLMEVIRRIHGVKIENLLITAALIEELVVIDMVEGSHFKKYLGELVTSKLSYAVKLNPTQIYFSSYNRLKS